MTKTNCLVMIFSIISLLTSCSGQSSKNSTQSEDKVSIEKLDNDSIELTVLIRQVYEWHMTKRINDFPYKYEEPGDTLFTGIDWEKYNNNIEVFKQTNFFSRDFLERHKEIASILDTSIKKADKEWRNINDGIPLWDTDADDWCGCQDYPDNYWEKQTIHDLNISNDFASFYWTWDEQVKSDSFKYKMTAKKENYKWKINSLEGFDYYYSVEHYNKLMNEYSNKIKKSSG